MSKKATKESAITSIDDVLENEVFDAEAEAEVEIEVLGTSSSKHFDLTIHQGEGELGSHAVFLSCNDNPYLVPRGRRVSVPEELIGVMEGANLTVYERSGDEIVSRTVPRYGYTVHGPSKK